MSMELMTFNNSEFGEIRTAELHGEPWFCLADVCRPLGLRPADCRQRLKNDGVVTTHFADATGRLNKMLFINEANLYRTIFQSRKPEAERFSDWVMEEVLPSIRKTGGYIAPTTDLSPAQLLAQQAQILVAQEQRINAIEEKIDRTVVAMAGPSGDRWTLDMKDAIRHYCEITGLTDAVARGRLYSALDQEARCNTDARLRCLRERKKRAGETRRSYMAFTKLDAIAVDGRLRVAFEGIVRRMTAQAELAKSSRDLQTCKE